MSRGLNAADLIAAGAKLPADIVSKKPKKLTVAPPTEKTIQKQCVDWLRLKGFYCVKIHQSLGSHRGIADYWIIKDGWQAWIEFKTAKGKQSEYQEKFEAEVDCHGGQYYVVRSLEEIQEVVGV